MTGSTIERLRDLSQRATEGPWEAVESDSLKYLSVVQFRCQSGPPGQVAMVGQEDAIVGTSELDRQNATAELIAEGINFLRDHLAQRPLIERAREIAAQAIEQQPDCEGHTGHMAATAASCRAGSYDDQTVVKVALAALSALPCGTAVEGEGAERPIPMLLYCPQCGLKHVDEPDERTPDWTNPPHRSHLCHGCGCIWRPADVPTNGVERIETQGKADTFHAEPRAALASPPLEQPDIEGRARELLIESLTPGNADLAAPIRRGETVSVSAQEATRAIVKALSLPTTEIRREALEEAAKVAEAEVMSMTDLGQYRHMIKNQVGKAIRSLASKEPCPPSRPSFDKWDYAREVLDAARCSK